MKLLQLTFLVFALSLIACQSDSANQETEGEAPKRGFYKSLKVQSFQRILSSVDNPQIIDVRTPEEFAQGHIANAQNINFHADDFLAQINKLNRDLPVFLYCQSGGRSKKSMEAMKDMNFFVIYELEGGYSSWEQ